MVFIPALLNPQHRALCPKQRLILSLVIGHIHLQCSSAASHAYTEDKSVPHGQTMHIYRIYVAA